ncbi:MAG: TlpA family protein disulfide reductase [Candidatus Omnitrophica bacterium]|nr:TlpA family protein disulfide reductase [Candidatus Omnitrophota bacterium]
MKNKGWIILILFLVILGLSGWKLFHNATDRVNEEITNKTEASSSVLKAWEFSLPDVSGEVFSLKDFRDKVVLLTFWTSRCPYCIREIPILKKIHAKYGGKDVEVLTVIIGEGKEIVNRIKKKEEIPYLILLDEYMEVSHLYKVIGVPTDIIIDREGNIKYYNFFWPNNLEEIIEELL